MVAINGSTHVLVTLFACWCIAAACPAVKADSALPVGPAPEPIPFAHFPDRAHAVIWRNWQLVEPSLIAKLLGTTEPTVREAAASMGLPEVDRVPEDWRRRGYATLVRRNWHLLPYEQLLPLIGMDADQFETALREDDFLFIKLGSLKPRCDPVQWMEPSPEIRDRVARIKQLVGQHFSSSLDLPAEPPFAFIEQLSRPTASPQQSWPTAAQAKGLRYLYSYFGTFGDPLADATLDPYPDGLLERLADNGINGVWLHVVLRQLAPGGEDFPEFGQGSERRLANLRQLVARCRRYGISVYLYMNEPRAMPLGFFADRTDVGGTIEGDHQTMCTSHPAVQRWMASALTHVFQQVPDLGGVFTITASENLTNCASHANRAGCPRCRSRTDAEVITEVNRVIADGVWRGNPNAKVICWDWGWANHGDASVYIPQLPRDAWLMSVSEWRKPIERGGIHSEVGEYSISAVGPGPRAEQHWRVAKAAGLKAAAKVQFNNSWELAAVPYLPVMDLVAQHCQELAKRDIDGMMLSWSLGGYPSPNLRIAQRFAEDANASTEQVLDDLAQTLYGPAGAPLARDGWTRMSQAFTEFPYDISVVYTAPMQYGPANLLFASPTDYRATMAGFPYDDLDSWRGPYPPRVFAEQFIKVAAGWAEGLLPLRQAAATATDAHRPFAESELRIATAAQLHFQSVANQARFVRARTELARADASADEKRQTIETLKALLIDELRCAKELFPIARQDSRIGFEATNHYFYVPLDLIEKVVNCEYLLERLEDRP